MSDANTAEVVEDAPGAEAEAEAPVEESNQSEDQGQKEAKPADSSTEKGDKDLQSRIDGLIRDRREARQAVDSMKAEIEHWKKEAAKSEPKQALEADKSLADFDYDEGQYKDYLINLASEQAQKSIQQRVQKESKVQQQAQFSAKEAQIAAENEDYYTLTRSATLAVTAPMVEVIQGSDKGPEVLYYLGKNPERAAIMSRMDIVGIAREVGRIETLLEKPVETSKAPKPPPKIDATESTVKVTPTSGDSDKLSTEEWMKRRNKQVRGK